MFVADTKILTRRGWKFIKDISGHDKVLVRNFIGDAEFVQPFALRKVHYDGEIVSFGNKDWGVSVTSKHRVVYNQPKKLGVSSPVTAEEIKANDGKLLFRRFRYIHDNKRDEKIIMSDGRKVSISVEDWYTIVAYAVVCGYIDKKNHPHVYFTAEAEKMVRLTNILDSIGIGWSWVTKQLGKPQIIVHNKSNLVAKLRRFLAARARRDMRLPDKAVYDASGAVLRRFIDDLIYIDGTAIKDRPGQFSWASINKKLIKNLEMMCLLCGYGFSVVDYSWSTKIRIIIKPSSSWNIREIKKSHYIGDVYSLDLFDGLVYVTEKSLPVWMSPK